MNEKVKCDKCGSLNVDDEHVVKDTPPLTMDEYISRRKSEGNWVATSGYYEFRKLVCKDCGYSKEYSIFRQSWMLGSGLQEC